jgi:hypothetical protein
MKTPVSGLGDGRCCWPGCSKKATKRGIELFLIPEDDPSNRVLWPMCDEHADVTVRRWRRMDGDIAGDGARDLVIRPERYQGVRNQPPDRPRTIPRCARVSRPDRRRVSSSR